MVVVKGKAGIMVKVIAHSISEMGVQLYTFEIQYPRLILAELNTHRMLSKNSSSSRAIPFLKMLDQLDGEPVRYGAANPGMQDKGVEHTASVYIDCFEEQGSGEDSYYTPVQGLSDARGAWKGAKEEAINVAKGFYEAGYHKQVYNRLLEPFQMMKTVVSATEIDNFFWLRDDDAADPTLRELAKCMREAVEQSVPVLLKPWEWHLPYVDYFEEVVGYEMPDKQLYGPKQYYIGKISWGLEGEEVDPNFQFITLEEAIKVSCARCAAVSYRNEGYGLAKSLELYYRLVGSDKKHASALEHCATPMKPHCYEPTVLKGVKAVNVPSMPRTWEEGISHMDRDSKLWSGNFKGFIQYRKLVPGENYVG